MEASVAAKLLIKIAALSGSLRQASYNRGLIRSAIEISKTIKGVQIEYIDIEPLPLINTDLESNGSFPSAVEAFGQKIREADIILFASPEYNYSIAEKLPPDSDSRFCFSQDRYIFHILTLDGLTFLCMANNTFGRRIPFAYLEDMHMRFMMIWAWTNLQRIGSFIFGQWAFEFLQICCNISKKHHHQLPVEHHRYQSMEHQVLTTEGVRLGL